jgi:hypothetical protein
MKPKQLESQVAYCGPHDLLQALQSCNPFVY